MPLRRLPHYIETSPVICVANFLYNGEKSGYHFLRQWKIRPRFFVVYGLGTNGFSHCDEKSFRQSLQETSVKYGKLQTAFWTMK